MNLTCALKGLWFLPVLGALFLGCPAMTPGTGARSGAGSLSPSHEAGDVSSAAPATKESEGGGAAPDVAYAEASKPYPGGAVAPGPDPEEGGKYYRAARGSAYRCKENVPTAAGFDKLATHTKLTARFVKVLIAHPSMEGPGIAVTCAKHYVRMTEGTGDAAKCTHFALPPDCQFGGNVVIQDPSAIRFQYSKYPSDEIPNEPCGLFPRPEDGVPDSALDTITNEVDFSDLGDTSDPPLCSSPQRASR